MTELGFNPGAAASISTVLQDRRAVLVVGYSAIQVSKKTSLHVLYDKINKVIRW